MKNNTNNTPAVVITSEHITDDLNVTDLKDRYNIFNAIKAYNLGLYTYNLKLYLL